MKNIKIFGQAAFFVLLCALTVLPGCNNVFEPVPEINTPTGPTVPGTQEKAAVSIVVNSGQRTVFPEAEIAGYKLYGSRTGTTTEPLAEFSGIIASVSLESGNWNFTLSAYNEEGVPVLQDQVQKEIKLDTPNSVVFDLVPLMEGEGDIEIGFNFPSDAGITKVTISGDIPDSQAIIIRAGQETFTWEKKSVNSGYHFVSFNFFRGEELATVFSELVQVSGDMTSRKLITLSGGELNPKVFTRAEGVNLAAKLSWLNTNAQSGGNYLIELSANETIAPASLFYGDRSDITISMIGTGTTPTIIDLSENGSMFTIGEGYDGGSGITLSLENNITLRGRATNSAPLVSVSPGGSLILNSGCSITGNIIMVNITTETGAYDFGGGGVLVFVGGSFTMNGGSVSGNGLSGSVSAAYGSLYGTGGGVCLYGGTFTMNGGEVSNNTISLTNTENDGLAYAAGGGVNLLANGTFTMNGGAISGNTISSTVNGASGSDLPAEPAALSFGGGVSVWGGEFTMKGGEISGNSASSSSGSYGNAYSGGGGVYLQEGSFMEGFFTKTGGTITGYSSDKLNGNRVIDIAGSSAAGHAVAVADISNLGSLSIYKDSTAGTTTDLFYGYDFDHHIPIWSGEWYDTENSGIGLAVDTWYRNSIQIDNAVVVYSLDVIKDRTYYIWLNDSKHGDGETTLDIAVDARYADGGLIFANIDSAWETPREFTANESGRVTLKVYSLIPGKTGSYAILAASANGTQTVTFDENGGSTEASPRTMDVVKPALTLSELPIPPERPNYAFVGWNTLEDGSGEAFTVETVVTENLTVYAQWKPVTGLIPDTWTSGEISALDREQWFSFNAAGDTQFIHTRFGSLTRVDVQVYDSKFNTVGSGTYLSGSTGYTSTTSRTVNDGELYYIKITPNDSNSGTYEIAITTILIPPGVSLTELTLDTWKDGNIPTSDGEQWFSFNAAGDRQVIQARFDSLSSMYVQVYDSKGNRVGYGTHLFSMDIFSQKIASYTVKDGEPYYIKVTPNSDSDFGTYEITFTKTPAPPGYSSTELTLDTWADGNIPTVDEEQWFYFTATGDTQSIHVSFGSLTYTVIELYTTSGDYTFIDGRGFGGKDGEINSFACNVTEGEVYYIKVTPWYEHSSGGGTYKIKFKGTPVPPGHSLNTDDIDDYYWLNREITTPDGEEWFSFTEMFVDGPYYIHVRFGSLTGMYVELYDTNGDMRFREALSGANGSIAPPLSLYVTKGETYYIKVTPYSDPNGGTYKITASYSQTPPPEDNL